jgi:Coenzyme PQQ synthesis protein D (PqqD)
LSSKALPQARQDGIVVRELPDEILIYDLEQHKAHCLNQTAGAVWRHCDGETSPREISYRLAREFSTPVDEDVVWLALDELGTLNLLESPVVRETGMSRAQLMRRVGVLTAAVALPAAFSLHVPSASASTCSQGCATAQDCVAPSCPACTLGACQPGTP